MRKREVLCLWTAACAFVACGGKSPAELYGSSSSAITHGVRDDGDDAVVALLQGALVLCSATVVAPRVVLTAAHCVAGDGASSLPDVAEGPDPLASGRRWSVERAWVHPLFDPVSHENDVALLVMRGSLPVAPLSLGRGSGLAGRNVRVVGFGRSTADSDRGLTRHDGEATVTAVHATTLHLAPDPSLPCFGDSGGPLLIGSGGAARVVGVVSFGNQDCTSHAVATRLDAYATEFLDPFSSEHAVPTGGRCLFDDNCTSGACIAPSDARSESYCDAACSTSGDCASPMTCTPTARGARCRFPEPSPGALGTACTGDADCQTTLCAAPPGASATVCATVCFPDDERLCPDGYDCRDNPSVPGASACFASPTASAGGCVVTPSARSDAASLAFVVCGVASAVARRRRRISRAR